MNQKDLDDMHNKIWGYIISLEEYIRGLEKRIKHLEDVSPTSPK